MTAPDGAPAIDRGMMVDVLGKLVVELRSSAAVAAIVGDRVAGSRPKTEWVAGTVAYVLIQRYGNARASRAPFVSGRVLVDCYGRKGPGGAQEATALYRAVSDALSAIGPRQSAGGVALYLSLEEIGGQASNDPETGQPVERSIYTYSAPLVQTS